MDIKSKKFDFLRVLLAVLIPLVVLFFFSQMFPYFENTMEKHTTDSFPPVDALFFSGFSSLYSSVLAVSVAAGAFFAIFRR